MTQDQAVYSLHFALAKPLEWAAVGAAAAGLGAAFYGAWRAQIGQPRDMATIVGRWDDAAAAAGADAFLRGVLPELRRLDSAVMRPLLRPTTGAPPSRQGNYAFRRFTTPEADLPEFLDLCAAAWPGFEAAYDSQVIGLWRFDAAPGPGLVETLLLTRRPDLAMWERSKLPQGAAEATVRAALSRRYDLCLDTHVVTTTLLSAADRSDDARWT
jgi:hypothetical protein